MKFRAPHFLLVVFILILLSCDTENTPPEIYDQSFSVMENSSPGLVFATVKALDMDGDRLRFSLNTESDDFPFEINKDNGELRIKTGVLLDYEQRQQYRVQVKVSDGMYSATALVTIHIINKPETAGMTVFSSRSSKEPSAV